MTNIKLFDEIRYFQRYELHEEALEIAEQVKEGELNVLEK